MGGYVTETCITHVFKNASCKFTREQIDELYGYIEDVLLEARAKEQNLDFEDYDSAGVQEQQTSGSGGFLSRLFGGKAKAEKAPIFSEEECFLYGIHPDDELYRKTMELDILSKDYRK